MKIVCVAGGSYKSFYLNHFIKLKKCDLLIFNYNILYDYDIKNELVGNSIVTKELLNLSKKLHCIVAGGIYQTTNNIRTKSIIISNGDKIYLSPSKIGAQINLKSISFIIGDERTSYKNKNKIVLTIKRIYPNLTNCSPKKTYIFCDQFGTTVVKNKKQKRKFNKFSQIYI